MPSHTAHHISNQAPPIFGSGRLYPIDRGMQQRPNAAPMLAQPRAAAFVLASTASRQLRLHSMLRCSRTVCRAGARRAPPPAAARCCLVSRGSAGATGPAHPQRLRLVMERWWAGQKRMSRHVGNWRAGGVELLLHPCCTAPQRGSLCALRPKERRLEIMAAACTSCKPAAMKASTYEAT